MRLPRKLKKKAKKDKESLLVKRYWYMQMAEELAKGFKSMQDKSMNALSYLNNK